MNLLRNNSVPNKSKSDFKSSSLNRSNTTPSSKSPFLERKNTLSSKFSKITSRASPENPLSRENSLRDNLKINSNNLKNKMSKFFSSLKEKILPGGEIPIDIPKKNAEIVISDPKHIQELENFKEKINQLDHEKMEEEFGELDAKFKAGTIPTKDLYAAMVQALNNKIVENLEKIRN